jgi:hypothetical protein
MAALYSPSFWSVKNAQTSPTDHSRTSLAAVSVFAASDAAADELAVSSTTAFGLAEGISLCLFVAAAAASYNIWTSQRGMGKAASSGATLGILLLD